MSTNNSTATLPRTMPAPVPIHENYYVLLAQQQLKRLGRPIEQTPETIAEIIRRIENGETIRGICEHKGMPDFSTVYWWMERDPAFSHAIARARVIQAHNFADKSIQVIENIELTGGRGDAALVNKMTNLSKALQWRASVQNRPEYGDIQHLQHSGAVGVVSFTIAGLAETAGNRQELPLSD